MMYANEIGARGFSPKPLAPIYKNRSKSKTPLQATGYVTLATVAKCACKHAHLALCLRESILLGGSFLIFYSLLRGSGLLSFRNSFRLRLFFFLGDSHVFPGGRDGSLLIV